MNFKTRPRNPAFNWTNKPGVDWRIVSNHRPPGTSLDIWVPGIEGHSGDDLVSVRTANLEADWTNRRGRRKLLKQRQQQAVVNISTDNKKLSATASFEEIRRKPKWKSKTFVHSKTHNGKKTWQVIFPFHFIPSVSSSLFWTKSLRPVDGASHPHSRIWLTANYQQKKHFPE